MKISVRKQSISLFAALGLTAVLTASTAAKPSEKILHAFQGGSDGALPNGGLIADRYGNLYGATEAGGTGTGCYGGKGCGTLFKLSEHGDETVLYSFQGGVDGISPFGPLLMDGSGNLFGATQGGAGDGCAGYGCGTVFKFAPDGTETVLYAFQGGNDGQYPEGGLIMDQDGNFYGATGEGGNYNGAACETDGCGTVFEVQPNGTKNTLYAFQGGSDGAGPGGGNLIADAMGNFYGTTTSGGGSGCNDNGCGTVFKLAPGNTETVLYAFQGGTDGEIPLAGVIADSTGNLYGTTFMGGTYGAGTVFEVSPTGQEKVLYSFKAGNDGANPEAGLIMDKNGNMYGTTFAGGDNRCTNVGSCGTVFELTPAGKETVLFAFKKSHGVNPAAALLLGRHDHLYGTTSAGGKYTYGVAFELK